MGDAESKPERSSSQRDDSINIIPLDLDLFQLFQKSWEALDRGRNLGIDNIANFVVLDTLIHVGEAIRKTRHGELE